MLEPRATSVQLIGSKGLREPEATLERRVHECVWHMSELYCSHVKYVGVTFSPLVLVKTLKSVVHVTCSSNSLHNIFNTNVQLSNYTLPQKLYNLPFSPKYMSDKAYINVHNQHTNYILQFQLIYISKLIVNIEVPIKNTNTPFLYCCTYEGNFQNLCHTWNT